MRLLLGFLFFLAIHFSFANEIKEKELVSEKKWLRLLHYKKNFLGNYKSEAAGSSFFLSPNGRHSPLAEFRANLNAFREKYDFHHSDKHALCRFPARRKWFFSKGLIHLPSKLNCPMFDNFKKVVNADKVSMVFSSYYLNNPSSAFGHTFLKFHRRDSHVFGEKAELLDNGVNYAAQTTTSNAFLYGVYGLTGVFKGYFAKLPFYYKVREYADYESRDLWGFRLNLTQPQVDELVDHLWELGQTYFDYYFLTKNCSYQLLALLEILDDRWNFSEKVPNFFVIPAETLKVINEVPGLVSEVSFRPSSRRVFEAAHKELSTEEKQIFQTIVKNKNPAFSFSSVDNQSKQKVLDAAIDYWDFKEAHAILKEEPWAMDLKQKFLIARSQVPLVSPQKKQIVPENENPLKSHDPSLFVASFGYGNYDKRFLDFQFRSAFHNKIDSWVGSPSFTSIEFFAFRGRYSFDFKKMSLLNFSFVNIESLTPAHSYHVPLSWAFKVGAERITGKNQCSKKENCVAGVVRLGGGGTIEPVSRVSISLLGDYEFLASSDLQKNSQRHSVGPRLIIYRPLFENFSFLYELKFYYHFLYKTAWSLNHDFVFNFKTAKNIETQLQASLSSLSREVSLGLRYFF
jgi:hypothetical protein